MHETHQSCVDVLLLQWIEHLLVKALAVGAFKIAEFNDGDRGLVRPHRGGSVQAKILNQFDGFAVVCPPFRLLRRSVWGHALHRGRERNPDARSE